MGVVDISLAVLIVLTAGYAGAVTWFVRGFATGAAAAAGVLATFALMLGLARVWLPGTILVAALTAGAIAYRTLARDLGRTRAAVAATAAGLVVGAAFAFVSYLAVMALIGAAGVYPVVRRRLRTRPALLVLGGTLGTLLVGSAAAFVVALSSM
jgi:hypothetical protein